MIGWNTSDADEVQIRQWRGRAEIAAVEALEPQFGPYGTFRVRSGTGGRYDVEIRDLEGWTNSCGCIDHRVNGLGTCKHIEGVLVALKKKMGVRAFKAATAEGPPRVEVFLKRDGEPVPALGDAALSAEIRAFLKPFRGKKRALAPILQQSRILDPHCRVCPKLEGVLSELLEEPSSKIIIFSEWVKMLELVRELAGEMGVDCAWHTGSVPQLRRRAEITRFRKDPQCRLFLSSDAGATGLNLQMANAVVNLDLPWNPAKLEQQIARAWRKGQRQAVTVVNFVTENSIEHSILHLLSHKQTLADGVLDGAEDFSKIVMPSGRAALIERMQEVLGGGKQVRIKSLPPEEALVEEIKARHGEKLVHAEFRAQRLILVLDAEPSLIEAERKRLVSSTPQVEILDRAAWQMLQRLTATGLVGFTETRTRILQQGDANGADSTSGQDMAA